jgi:toxin HigB-1
VIKSFADSRTEAFWILGRSKHFPASIHAATRRKLSELHHAQMLDDLASPPGNRLKALKSGRAEQYSIRINDQYRLCFEFRGGDAYNVEIVDYH